MRSERKRSFCKLIVTNGDFRLCIKWRRNGNGKGENGKGGKAREKGETERKREWLSVCVRERERAEMIKGGKSN